MKKTVTIIMTLKGYWTEDIEKIMHIENIPPHADHISTYNEQTNETWISFVYTEEREAALI